VACTSIADYNKITKNTSIAMPPAEN
jgi:hypothetical protein